MTFTGKLHPTGRPATDLTGRVFGRLTIVDRAPNKGTRVQWNCVCSCGNTPTVDSSDLTRAKGGTKSCGCLRKESMARIATRHGHFGSREYRSWDAAKQRCYNPNAHSYENYGGRGVTMCSRWVSDFAVFLSDMGPRPEGTSLDRIDVNGNYEPGNCRWADRVTQRNNRRQK